MSRVIDLTGLKFGRLTVIKRAENNPKGGTKWLCTCECGRVKNVLGANLYHGKTLSCGCLNIDLARERYTVHGLGHTRLFNIWCNMRQRCNNVNNKNYIRYGARGISVCEEWNASFVVFADWALSNGYASNLSIDRIDNNGNYEPGNCRWATPYQQCINKRSNTLVTIGGITKPLCVWANDAGIKPNLVYNRVTRGWPYEKAIFTPIANNSRN